jgi:hypothetical protein
MIVQFMQRLEVGYLMGDMNLICYCEHKRGTHIDDYQCQYPDCICRTFRMDISVPEATAEKRGAVDSGLKDSGARIEFGSGMVRDVAGDKPGFQYMFPKGVPMNKQMITRVADHLRKGAVKYSPRNWEKGDSDEEAERARESALRHMMQYIMGETDEDHAAAVIINIIFAETMQYKANQKKEV